MHLVKPKGSRFYRGRYRLSNGPKWYDVALRVAQKDIAEAKLRNIVRDAEAELAGLIAPKPLRDAAQASIETHLADYTADLTAQGCSKKHVALSGNRVRRLCAECGWKLLRDVSADGFSRWRAGQTFALKTSNEYLGLASAFMNWLVRNGRVSANPLSAVVRADTRGKETRVRRALSDEEFGRLLAHAGRRRLFYALAAYTGLRRGEIKALLWTDLHLDTPQPFVTVRASTSKNKRQASLPLPAELAALLREKRGSDARKAGKVFPVGVPTAKSLRADLAAAGIAAKDEQGRVVDIHALRKTFCTMLHVAGVAPRTAQELMRHSERRLTDTVYAESSLLPLRSELAKVHFPRLSQTMPEISGKIWQNGGKTVPTEPSGELAQSPALAGVVHDCPTVKVAERVGFEPTLGYKPKPHFECGAFNHSATSPCASAGSWGSLQKNESRKFATPTGIQDDGPARRRALTRC